MAGLLESGSAFDFHDIAAADTAPAHFLQSVGMIFQRRLLKSVQALNMFALMVNTIVECEKQIFVK